MQLEMTKLKCLRCFTKLQFPVSTTVSPQPHQVYYISRQKKNENLRLRTMLTMLGKDYESLHSSWLIFEFSSWENTGSAADELVISSWSSIRQFRCIKQASYRLRGFCLYPDFILSISLSLVFLFLSIFNLYLSSLSLSYIPCQCISPVNGHNHISVGWSSSSAASAKSSSILFNRVKLKYFAQIKPWRFSIGCCSSNEPECGSMYTIFLALW